MKSDRALVLLSGGIDSAVISIVAAQQHSYIHFLTFDYSQVNRREIACARKISRMLTMQGPHTLLPLDLSPSVKSGRSGLLSPRPRGHRHQYGYYVPGRNMIFLAHAASIAESNDINTIYIGSNLQDAAGTPRQDDSGEPTNGYPDSGGEFLQLAENALNRGLKYANRIRIEAPLLAMNKFEAIRYGRDHQFDFRSTWSCYQNGPRACGTCPACRARLLNFHWAGLVDPVSYEEPYESVLSKALDPRASGRAPANHPESPPREESISSRGTGGGGTVSPSNNIPPVSRAIVGFEAARRHACGIELNDPVVNRSPGRARELAAAYRKYSEKHEARILHAQWLPGGPYTRDVLHLLRHVEDLQIDFASIDQGSLECKEQQYSEDGYAATLARLRKSSVEPTLNIIVGLPYETEAGVLEALTRAYALAPNRVSVSQFVADPDSRALQRPSRHRASAIQINRLLHICQVSANSYNYWKQLGTKRRERGVDSEVYQFSPAKLSGEAG